MSIELRLIIGSVMTSVAIVLGGVIVHAKVDDGSQPVGNAGGRIACGASGWPIRSSPAAVSGTNGSGEQSLGGQLTALCRPRALESFLAVIPLTNKKCFTNP